MVSVCAATVTADLSVCLCVCLAVDVSVDVSVCLSVCLSSIAFDRAWWGVILRWAQGKSQAR
jgi:hypothetical protein